MATGMVLFWGLLILALVLLVRAVGNQGAQGGGRGADAPTPERLLAERFARGEIDDEEYRRRLAILHGDAAGRAMR
ncbi:MAG: SHOCT domain-containing protein [Mycobacteriales bacterium]